MARDRVRVKASSNMKGEEKVNMEQQQPPPYGSYPYQQQPQVVVIGQPIMAPRVGKLPEVVSYLNCRAEVRSRVERSLSQNGWIWSFVLWFLTGCCCFIPCVMDAFHDYVHQCPNCGVIIGKSTPDDREAERKKGLRVVIGAIIASIVFSILLVVIYFVVVLGILYS